MASTALKRPRKKAIKWLIYSLLILGLHSLTRGQNHSIGDTTKVLVLIEKANNYLNENALHKALETSNEAEGMAKNLKWKQGLLKVYLSKASIQNVSNQHYEAISTGLKGLNLAKELNSKYHEVAFYRSLANNHDMLDNYEVAIPYYEKCLESSEYISEVEKIRGHCYVELGDAFRIHFKDPEKAKELIENGIAIYQKLDSSVLGYAYDYLGEALTDLKMFAQAEEVFKKSRTQYEKYQDYYLIPELLFHTANLYLAEQKYPTAIKYAKEGVFYSQKMKTIYGESEAHRTLYEVYKAINKPELALKHFERHTVLRDSMNMANIDNRFKQVEMDVQLQKQESRIKELVLKQQKNQLQTQQLWLYGLLALLLFTALFIFYFRALNKKLKKKNTQISEALLLGQAIERKRVATDLHDTIGANLSSINWTLDVINTENLPSKEKGVFQNLKKQLAQTYEQVKLLTQNLVPEELEKRGLVLSLKNLVRKNNDSLRAKHTLKIDEKFKVLHPKVEFQLYYICLELMNQSKNELWGEISLEEKGNHIQLKHSTNEILTKGNDDTSQQNVALRVEILNGKLKREINNIGVQTTIITVNLSKLPFH